MQPNKNCNLSSWLAGCEPGWACNVGPGQKVDLKNSEIIPSRTTECAPCCEGFFCPHGLTCMIRKSSIVASHHYKFLYFQINQNYLIIFATYLYINSSISN